MILWDVNILVYAFRSDSPFHATARQRVVDALHREEPFLFLNEIALSFLRIVTNPRIFKQPSTLENAWGFLGVLEESPSVQRSRQDDMTFGIFKHLSLVQRATGNSLPDTWLAASAIRHNARLLTADRGFLSIAALEVELIDGGPR